MLFENQIKDILLTALILLLLATCKNENEIIPPGNITSISPKTGQPGTAVKIRGTNFGSDRAKVSVTFNGVDATIVQLSDTLLEVTAPSGSQSGLVELVVRDQKITGPEFKYYNLYFYGRKDLHAAYWKDNTPVTLDFGYLVDLAVSGTDVHAIGYIESASSPTMPTYWKNGQPMPLEDLTLWDRLTSIATSGQDIYICATREQSSSVNTTARYWKNGKLIFSTELTDDSFDRAYDIAASGNDVYMVGTNYGIAKMWKNGIVTFLSDANSSTFTVAQHIRIIGSDVHIIGTENSSVIRYWKNGIATPLEGSPRGFPSSFALTDGHIYISGDGTLPSFQPDQFFAKYWDNGVEHVLTPNESNHYAAAIEVTDDALYILNDVFGGTYPAHSTLTKNGATTSPVFEPSGSVSGMLVVYY
jgi:hypothetical protein